MSEQGSTATDQHLLNKVMYDDPGVGISEVQANLITSSSCSQNTGKPVDEFYGSLLSISITSSPVEPKYDATVWLQSNNKECNLSNNMNQNHNLP